MEDLPQLEEFDWDEGNIDKNWIKHRIDYKECEEVFLDNNRKILGDTLHSDGEERFIILGKTNRGKLLYLVFTIRNNKFRIISARDINQKEIKLYEEET